MLNDIINKIIIVHLQTNKGEKTMDSLKKFEIEKLKQIVLYILNKTQKISYYKLMKMIFCSDRNNLLKWGDMITNQCYVPLLHGPVPSELYTQIEKMKEGKDNFLNGIVRLVDQYNIEALTKANEDYLSVTDKESIENGIQEVQNKSNYKELEDSLHDDIYKRLKKEKRPYSEIDIAESGEANSAQIERIKYEESLRHALV